MGKDKIESKRAQVDKANSMVFVAVAIASVVVVFSAVMMKFLWDKQAFNSKVIAAKTEARDQLQQNSDNISKLEEQYKDLNDAENSDATTILHALPPQYDYAALASSIEALAQASGVSSDTDIGEDMSESAIDFLPESTPQEIPIKMNVSGDYDSIKRYMTNIERSIRPIKVSVADFSYQNGKITASITGVTYYQPARSLDVNTRSIQ